MILGLVLVVVLVRRARRGTKDHSPPEPPTFRIVALGTSGAGKTVFLSSLFHKLNYRAPGRSYHLEADPAQRIALANVYREVSSTTEPWPSGTRVADMREFVFDCVASDAQSDRHAVLRMSCLDFAGELLHVEQEGGTKLDELVERIKGAHALLAMIDGRRVLQLLLGEPEGDEYVASTLRPMFGMMQSASCPLHLVLTKWDLVRDFGEPADADDAHRLGRVIDVLMAYDYLRALVKDHSRGQIVRLIPVSAVGPGFAELDAEGRVVKRRDGRVEPTNVEVPFCAVLPDLFRQVEGSLDAAARRTLRERLAHDSGALVAGVAQFLSGPALATFGLIAGGALAYNPATQVLLDWLSRPGEGDARGERQVAELHRLRRIVLDDFTRAVMRLEATLPNSQLSEA